MRHSNFTKVALQVFALFAITFAIPLAIAPASAQVSSLVCIANPSTTNCPSSPPTFTGNVGQSVSIAINIENSPSFNGVDIAVKADPTEINGTSIDTTGNAFQAAGGMLFIAAECINNQPVVGNCTSQDAMGVVHFAATSNAMVTGGHMFNINYLVTGSGSTGITYQTGCAGTSNDSFCVTIVSGSTLVPENLQTATFTTGAPAPDFNMTASPNSLSIQQGSCASSTITLASINSFSGTVALSSSVSPPGPSTTLQPTTVMLSAGGSGTSTLTVCTMSSTPAGPYTVTVTGGSGSISHLTTVSVTVAGLPDFIISITPASGTTTRASSTNFIVYLNSVNGFVGTISLQATFSPVVRHSPTAQFNPANVPLSSGGSATSVLSIDASHSTTLGTYTVTVTGTSATISHSVTVAVTVTR